MVFYAGGDAFRTGTHKAMIFTWLRRENRLDEKTRVYGITRSWSKIGAAFSLLPATACVFWLRDYAYVFWFSMIPYVSGHHQFLVLSRLAGRAAPEGFACAACSAIFAKRLPGVGRSRLRRLILESMTYEGMFKSGKDYLQPVVKQAALALPGSGGPGNGIPHGPADRRGLLRGRTWCRLSAAGGLTWCADTASEDAGVRVVWRLVLSGLSGAGAPALFRPGKWWPSALSCCCTFCRICFGPCISAVSTTFRTKHAGPPFCPWKASRRPWRPWPWPRLLGAAVDLVGAAGNRSLLAGGGGRGAYLRASCC